MTKWMPSLFLLLALPLSGCGYNALQSADEQVNAAWSEVLNQYQRRADLVPNLVSVVRGYAAHEEAVLTRVTEARAAVGRAAGAGLPDDAEAFARFQAAQRAVSGAVGGLLAVAERYPDLKADRVFRDLQAQLEGTENRIAVARKRFIDAVRDYNVTVRAFPSNLTARVFGYPLRPGFAVEDPESLASPPPVELTPAAAPARP